ncbi:hypothetical protein GCM10009735_14460 [Actinomadura chokoriensis]
MASCGPGSLAGLGGHLGDTQPARGDGVPRWRGWTLTDHGDAYEEVAALIGPELRIEPPPDPAGDILYWLERNAVDPGVRERIRAAAREGA